MLKKKFSWLKFFIAINLADKGTLASIIAAMLMSTNSDISDESKPKKKNDKE